MLCVRCGARAVPTAATFREIVGAMGELLAQGKIRGYGACNDNAVGLMGMHAAAKELVAAIGDSDTVVIDASTAYRTADGWDYGFAEMTKTQGAAIAASKRVSNPGCYPQGVIACLRPLIEAGLLPADYPVTINAISGYSGGGRQMIEAYEAPGANKPPYLPYGLGFRHKHLPELTQYATLASTPIFIPSVGNYAQGMVTSVPLRLETLAKVPTGAEPESMW